MHVEHLGYTISDSLEETDVAAAWPHSRTPWGERQASGPSDICLIQQLTPALLGDCSSTDVVCKVEQCYPHIQSPLLSDQLTETTENSDFGTVNINGG